MRRQLRLTPAGCGRIIVGAGGTALAGWVSTDVDVLDLTRRRDWARVVPSDGLRAILAEHVWEHLTPEAGRRAARLCYEYLRPGGYLRIAVPDGYHPAPEYQEWVRPGGSGPGADDHKVLYTYQTLSALLTGVGFDVRLLEYFDRDGQFHFVEWSPADGAVERSSRFDERNRRTPLAYTSLILDAVRADAAPASPAGVR